VKLSPILLSLARIAVDYRLQRSNPSSAMPEEFPMRISRPMRSLRQLSCVVLMSVSTLSIARAETFPPGAIRIVVPTAASTPPDIISRVIASELSETEGWRVIVENRPGGAMTIAGTDVLSQPANGTSIYAMSVPVTAAPSILPSMPFRLDSDFARSSRFRPRTTFWL
jgi:hypothetical protein